MIVESTNVENMHQSPAIAKPFVSRSTFYQGDCLVEMDKIADKSVDMILCDLPYGSTNCKWDNVIPFEPIWKHYERIIKDNGAIVLFGSEPFSSLLRCSNLKRFKYDWIWQKNKAGNFQIVKYQPLKYHEIISVFSFGTHKYYPILEKASDASIQRYKYKFNSNKVNLKHMASGEYNHKFENGIDMKNPSSIITLPNERNTFHPTQKPVSLMEYLILTYTNEGETVLDNCMGSGTTGVACKKTGRHFIGIEKDEKYFEIAVNRINSYV